ncbi:MAG: hypothetical protein ACT4OL_04775 [Nitrospiraceae bacterium]
MAFLVYLVRSPTDSLPHSLFPPDDLNVVVLRIEVTASTAVPLRSVEVLQPGDVLPFKEGEKLTYKQLFDVISRAGKVITL